jgi:hypothetical protein
MPGLCAKTHMLLTGKARRAGRGELSMRIPGHKAKPRSTNVVCLLCEAQSDEDRLRQLRAIAGMSVRAAMR